MIEIPEPPDIRACGACMSPLHWLYSHERQAWVALIPGPDRWTPQWHRCRSLQEPVTWRALSAVPDPQQAERNAAGRAAVEQALKNKERTEGESA